MKNCPLASGRTKGSQCSHSGIGGRLGKRMALNPKKRTWNFLKISTKTKWTPNVAIRRYRPRNRSAGNPTMMPDERPRPTSATTRTIEEVETHQGPEIAPDHGTEHEKCSVRDGDLVRVAEQQVERDRPDNVAIRARLSVDAPRSPGEVQRGA
jgi:hypothetical protein